jgi:hypothetical protein
MCRFNQHEFPQKQNINLFINNAIHLIIEVNNALIAASDLY